MKLLKANPFIALIILSVLLISILISFLWASNNKKEKLLLKCPSYHYINEKISPFPAGNEVFVDCIGNLVVNFNDFNNSDLKYSLYDFKNNYKIASFVNDNKYKIIENYLYVYDQGGCDDYNGSFVNGKIKYSKCVDKLSPMFKKINSTNSEVSLFNGLDEMSINDREVFEQLINGPI